MPKIAYIPRTFAPKTEAVIQQAEAIINDIRGQGYTLSLRQLYYQFVSRDLIPNRDTEYKRLGSIINDARLAGRIDWTAIEDRGRNVAGGYGYDHDPRDSVRSIGDYFQLDRWKGQRWRPEVWVEKDALSGVVGRVADELDVPYLACKGYMSQSEMWQAGRRFMRYRREGQQPIVIHLGDHDPSGIDMSRDIEDRLAMFAEAPVRVVRVALNMDQVLAFDPPPNPTKQSDSRSTGYLEAFGEECWELDALPPASLAQIIRDAIEPLRDDDALEAVREREREAVINVRSISEHWDKIIDWLTEGDMLVDAEEEGDDD